MPGIALRRFGKRTVADIEIHALDSSFRRKGPHGTRDQRDGALSPDSQDRDATSGSESESDDDLLSPDSPSPLSPDFPPELLPPTSTIDVPPPPPVTTSIEVPPPPVTTTEPVTSTAIIEPPAPTTTFEAQPILENPVDTIQPPKTTVGEPQTTLLPPPPPEAIIKDPARENSDTTTTLLTSTRVPGQPLTTLTPIAPPKVPPPTTTPSTTQKTSTAAEASPTTTAESLASTSTPTDTTSITTRFVLSSTGFVDGVPTTLLITLPTGEPTTLSTRVGASVSPSSTAAITTRAGFTPVESALPILQPSETSTPPTKEAQNDFAPDNAQTYTIGPGGVAALSIVIALASIATIVFVVYKCCWPLRKRGGSSSKGFAAFGPLKRFWDKPNPAVRGESPVQQPYAVPPMAHVRPDDRVMDQVMAAAYEAEQGNAGVYGKHGNNRGSWHTDDSSILEEKQRQYEAAVAASAVNGTAPPDPRKSKALQLGQMMNNFLSKRHEKGAGAEMANPPDSPAGTTSGPTAFMPKNSRVEWSWRISVGSQFRRASNSLRGSGDGGGDGWFKKATKLGSYKG